MLPDLAYAAIRYENFVQEILLPGAFPQSHPLAVSVWQTADHVRPEHAVAQAFEPVPVGWRWGPVWSTAWFRVAGSVPASMAGKRVALRFSSGTEALLWKGGVPDQGFDPYRDLALLWEAAPAGAPVEALIEAACNQPLGISTFWWDHPELHARWKEERPGRLERAELVEVDEDVWRFAQAFDLARKVLQLLPENSARAHELDRGLRALLADMPVGGDALRTACRAQWPRLATLVMGRGPQGPVTVTAVGHAHIDTAWLWTLGETRRKCLRTFANVLRLQERFPAFHFLCSQAQQYAWVQERSPELFQEITQRVREGRWEPAGAMWIEPDCTCPSGESFIRQILHGTGWWQAAFGEHAPQRFLYLPDTFGFPASMPQIMAQAGLDTFITNKMSWCESNRFPNVTFWWRGIDGTEVLTHLTPGHNYNSSLEPKDLQYAQDNLTQQDGARVPDLLQPFGWGDGGGGPTAEQIARAEMGARCEGLPRVQQGRVWDFCERLHQEQRRLRAQRQDVRTWDGELYLELHRGTYTSQAWIKTANRQAELAARLAEVLACARAGLEEPAHAARARQELDSTWKTVLLNQFHDILPGSSIGPVYDEARQQMQDVRRTTLRAVQRGMVWLGEKAGGGGAGDRPQALLVFNPSSAEQSGPLPTEEGIVWAEAVPPLGVRVVQPGAACTHAPVKATGQRVLSNGLVEIEIDEVGRIARLVRLPDGRVANAVDASGATLPMNQLMMFVDRPRRWEAWDVDRDYAEQVALVDTPAARIQVEQSDRGRADIVVERPLGERSHLVQRYRMTAGSPRVDIITDVDWQEQQKLLRAHFPCGVRTRRATFGIQFGCVERATHENTSWERAQFEVPGHDWMDLSEPGLGVAVLDDGKFGRSAKHGVLGLSLLRAPGFPDPHADRGRHRFTYAVMAHHGCWRTAGVDAQAEALNNPLLGMHVRGGGGGGAGSAAGTRAGVAVRDGWQAVRVQAQAPARLHVAALKPAEHGNAVVLRLVEMHGAAGSFSVDWGFPVKRVWATDLHEAARAEPVYRVRPFQIITLLAELPA